MSHAVHGQRLFRSVPDFKRYLGLLQRVVERQRWTLLSFVLMSNHVHLLVRAVPAQLSEGFWYLNGGYAAHYKQAYRPRMGHVFSGRPKLKPITTDRYLLAAARYIALNPDRPAEYRWSAHRAILGAAPSLPILASDELLRWFDSPDAVGEYERFVTGADPAEHRSIRRWVRHPAERPELSVLLADLTPETLREAHETWDYSLRAIAAEAGMSHTSVRRAILRCSKGPGPVERGGTNGQAACPDQLMASLPSMPPSRWPGTEQ